MGYIQEDQSYLKLLNLPFLSWPVSLSDERRAFDGVFKSYLQMMDG